MFTPILHLYTPHIIYLHLIEFTLEVMIRKCYMQIQMFNNMNYYNCFTKYSQNP